MIILRGLRYQQVAAFWEVWCNALCEKMYYMRLTWQTSYHDDIIKGKHFPRYWLFMQGIHRWPVNSPHKVQRRGVLMFSLICAWINGWVNNDDAGDLRRHRAYYDVRVMEIVSFLSMCRLLCLRACAGLMAMRRIRDKALCEPMWPKLRTPKCVTGLR